MTISLISTGEHFDYYTKARAFFSNKGITYKMCGPYSVDHKVSFNLPLCNTDNDFYKTQAPLYSYKSDLADWVADMIKLSGDKKNLPMCGLIILFGDSGEKVKSYLKSCQYHEVLNRISIITNPETFDADIDKIWDKIQIFWAKEENKRIK